MVRALDGRVRKTVATKPLTEEQRALAEGACGLIEVVARRYARTAIPLDERIGWATDGLIDAAATFDPTVGVDFEAWAGYRMKMAIKHGVREGYANVIKVGRNAKKSVGAEKAALLRNMKSTDHWYESNSNWDSDRGVTLIDLARVDRPVCIDREMIRKAVRRLGLREAIMLSMRYGYGWRLKDIGKRLGVSESRVSQMVADCLDRLRSDPRTLEAMTA